MNAFSPFTMVFAGCSDVGRQRSRNEDSFQIKAEAGLAVVCDGMGGHAGGDLASRTAAAMVVDVVADTDVTMPTRRPIDDADLTLSGPMALDPTMLAAISLIRHAVQEANFKLVSLNRERGFADGRGMGTTLVGLWQVEGTDRLITFHAGDSRLYRLRDGALTQMTRDHSLYQVWVDSGSKGPAPQRNIIVRALGTAEQAEPDVAVHGVQPGDVYLLCTDGLSGLVEDREIADILARTRGELDGGAKALIQLANDRGGHDNITVVLAYLRPSAERSAR